MDKLREFYLTQIAFMRNELKLDFVLFNADYKLSNLKKIYNDLKDLHDMQ